MLAIATKIYSGIPPIRRRREKSRSSARSSVVPEDRHVSTASQPGSALKLVISITDERQLAAITAARLTYNADVSAYNADVSAYNADVSAGGPLQAGRGGNAALKTFDSNEDYITFWLIMPSHYSFASIHRTERGQLPNAYLPCAAARL